MAADFSRDISQLESNSMALGSKVHDARLGNLDLSPSCEERRVGSDSKATRHLVLHIERQNLQSAVCSPEMASDLDVCISKDVTTKRLSANMSRGDRMGCLHQSCFILLLPIT